MELKEYILKNECLEIHVCNLGGIIKNLFVRDYKWKQTDVVLGFDNVEQYAAPTYLNNYPYFGALIGRYGNRIKDASFEIDGQTFSLAKNDNGNCLHSGAAGFDKRVWNVEQPDDEHLILRLSDQDGTGGFPGKLDITVRYSIEQNVFRVIYEATSDKATHVNLTQHPYFNLNPDDENIGKHELRLYSKRYLETTPDLIPTGNILPAEGKYAFNFNKPLFLALQEDGLDDCYVYEDLGEPQLMAELSYPKNGITITILSDYPGLQVYTGKHIDVANGKGGKHYGAYSGIALEAQMFPDSPHHPSFPSTLLQAGEVYRHKTVYSFNCFSVEKEDWFGED
ncbi:aldose epimerase family protein [Butyricimonas synergistica]|uniref:aldose epimerase family protein n=1 Tax=Butyricimonas synergistica TaxID=544644 RepID=UPI00037C5F59|nr:aldose epimerase family protein [Butyricimonas synergistica]